MIKIKNILYPLTVATILALSGCGSSVSSDDAQTRASGAGGTQTTGSYIGQPPVAYAGEDITVGTGEPITLDGSGSSDPDGNLVSYEWRASSGEGIKSASPILELGSLPIGVYIATLIVTDDQLNTATDSMTITVTEATAPPAVNPPPAVTPPPADNVPPVAKAGADQTITQGDDLHLDGSASTDSDGTIVKYAWYDVTNPTATTLGATVTITGLGVGTYTIELKVTDDDGATGRDSMVVTVVAPVADCPDGNSFITHNGTDYCTVTSPDTGKVWLDRNLGAAQVCTALDDVACYGDYYQWGRNFDGHQDSGSATTATLAADVNNVGHGDFIKNAGFGDWAAVAVDDNGVTRAANWSTTVGNSVCPAGFRVPTETELGNETGGFVNNIDAFDSFLKLPSAGSRSASSGNLDTQGSVGYLWSSTANVTKSYYFYFAGTVVDFDSNGIRSYAYSVRCLKD